MEERNSTGGVIDREKNWDSIFNALLKLTKNLDNDRRLLEGRIKYLNEVVYKLMMEQKVQSMKGDFLLGLKEREAFIYKHRYENANKDLDSFHEWVEYLVQTSSDQPNASNELITMGESLLSKEALENEIEKCQMMMNSEISALLTTETELCEIFRKKDHELEQTNGKLSVLVERVGELEKSNERLRNEFAKIQSVSDQKSNEISRLMKEIELLKSRLEVASPLVSSFRANTATVIRKRVSTGRKIRQVKKEVNYSIVYTRQSGERAASMLRFLVFLCVIDECLVYYYREGIAGQKEGQLKLLQSETTLQAQSDSHIFFQSP